MTPELKELTTQAETLQKEYDNAKLYEAQQENNAKRESVSIKKLPTETLLANNGVNINFTQSIELQRAQIEKEALSVQKAIEIDPSEIFKTFN